MNDNRLIAVVVALVVFGVLGGFGACVANNYVMVVNGYCERVLPGRAEFGWQKCERP